MGGHPGYVKECTSGNCRMYPFRMGADPRPNQAKAELARQMNAQKPTQVRDVLLPEFAKEVEPVEGSGQNTEWLSVASSASKSKSSLGMILAFSDR